MKRRGWVEVHEGSTGWDVYDWSEHHDSGYQVGNFADRTDAILKAADWAREHGRKIGTVADE